MVSLTDDDLDGVNEGRRSPDEAIVRVFCKRTDRDAYPSGSAYKLPYGATEPDPPRTLDDGTIRRYDNSHEATKGHELHVAPDHEPAIITSQEWSNSGNDSGAKSRNPNSRSIEHIPPRRYP